MTPCPVLRDGAVVGAGETGWAGALVGMAATADNDLGRHRSLFPDG